MYIIWSYRQWEGDAHLYNISTICQPNRSTASTKRSSYIFPSVFIYAYLAITPSLCLSLCHSVHLSDQRRRKRKKFKNRFNKTGRKRNLFIALMHILIWLCKSSTDYFVCSSVVRPYFRYDTVSSMSAFRSSEHLFKILLLNIFKRSKYL